MFKPYKTLFLTISFCSIFFMTSNSQQSIKTYSKEWKKAEYLAKKNLPKSALAEVKKIYALAKKENQDAQVIKALVYMTGLQSETREDNEVFSIKEVEKERDRMLSLSPPPHTLLLAHSFNILHRLSYYYFF